MNKNFRKCIGCNTVKDRNDMFRILTEHGTKDIIISPSNKEFGRSVYICKNEDCIKNAFKKGKISRYIKHAAPEELKKQISDLLIK